VEGWDFVSGASAVAGVDSVLTAIPMLTQLLLFFSIIIINDLAQTTLQ